MLRKSRPYEKNTKTKVKLKMRKHKSMEYEHKKSETKYNNKKTLQRTARF